MLHVLPNIMFPTYFFYFDLIRFLFLPTNFVYCQTILVLLPAVKDRREKQKQKRIPIFTFRSKYFVQTYKRLTYYLTIHMQLNGS